MAGLMAKNVVPEAPRDCFGPILGTRTLPNVRQKKRASRDHDPNRQTRTETDTQRLRETDKHKHTEMHIYTETDNTTTPDLDEYSRAGVGEG